MAVGKEALFRQPKTRRLGATGFLMPNFFTAVGRCNLSALGLSSVPIPIEAGGRLARRRAGQPTSS